jgi:hypothetical protein
VTSPGPDSSRSAEQWPTSSPQHGPSGSHGAQPAADLHLLVGGEVGQARGNGGEVVVEQQPGDAQLLGQSVARDVPRNVDHLHFITEHRCGNGQRCPPGPLALRAPVKIGKQQRAQIRVVPVAETVHGHQPAPLIQERTAAVGGADVGNKIHGAIVVATGSALKRPG